MEATEMGEFGKEMKEAGEASMTHVSLIISVLAVMVAMVTVMGHRTHTEAVLEQAHASDTWNEYQSRKMRVQLLMTENHLLSLQAPINSADAQTQITANKANIDKWNDELKEAADKAKEDEFAVHLAEKKATRWDLGEALLEIAVVLTSITLLTKKQMYVLGGLVLGISGLLIAASALLVR